MRFQRREAKTFEKMIVVPTKPLSRLAAIIAVSGDERRRKFARVNTATAFRLPAPWRATASR